MYGYSIMQHLVIYNKILEVNREKSLREKPFIVRRLRVPLAFPETGL